MAATVQATKGASWRKPVHATGQNNKAIKHNVHTAVCSCTSTGVYGVAKMLGLYQPPDTYFYMDNMTRSASKALTPPPSSVRAGRHLAAAPAAQCIHWKHMAAHVYPRPLGAPS